MRTRSSHCVVRHVVDPSCEHRPNTGFKWKLVFEDIVPFIPPDVVANADVPTAGEPARPAI